MPRTLVLGGGFGGIAVATELRAQAGDGHEIVLVDRAESFSMGLRKLWELVGHGTIADGSRSRHVLGRRGIRVVREEIRAIDATARAVATTGGTIEGDRVVVALGAESRPDLVAGLAEHGHDIWSAAGVPAAAEALAGFDGGRILMLIAGAPYPCPPAPYECAMLVDEHLRARGVRESAEILIATVQPMLMPNAGRKGSDWMGGQLAARGIATRAGCKVERVEAVRVVLAGGEELPFELLLAVPPHRAPTVVVESGLTGESGWIMADRGTFATAQPGVFAVGDVTLVKLANGLPLPKAGLMAERQGSRVAAAIAAELQGAAAPPPFDGKGFCFIELGVHEAALLRGDFYAEPEPDVAINEATAAYAEEKREFERERLDRWF